MSVGVGSHKRLRRRSKSGGGEKEKGWKVKVLGKASIKTELWKRKQILKHHQKKEMEFWQSGDQYNKKKSSKDGALQGRKVVISLMGCSTFFHFPLLHFSGANSTFIYLPISLHIWPESHRRHVSPLGPHHHPTFVQCTLWRISIKNPYFPLGCDLIPLSQISNGL